ncbi:MAG TPA: hypothetical protein VIU11_09570 [Nakamurella sp.]
MSPFASTIWELSMNQRNVWIRAVTAGLAVAEPIVVGISRMHQGVRYLTHVVVGRKLSQ